MTKVRVGMLVAGQFRRLFSIAENKKGELLIGFQSAEIYKFEPEGPKIVQQKYTVHASRDSERYNTITHTLILSDGRRLRSYSVTDAIKSKSGFALLFGRQCPDLSTDRYLLANKKQFVPVVLREYDTKLMTPVYAVFVGNAGTEFDTSLPTAFTIKQSVFQQFRLITIHSGFPIPSHRTGELVHSMTFKPEDAPPALQYQLWNIMKGRSSNSCLETAEVLFREMLGRYIRRLIKIENVGGKVLAYLQQLAKSAGVSISPQEEPELTLLLSQEGQDTHTSATPE